MNCIGLLLSNDQTLCPPRDKVLAALLDVGPVTFFLDLVEIEATDANGIVAALMHCLVSHGFSEEFLGGSCSRWCVSDAGK